MNRMQALQLFAAAETDPILASWAAVLYEHGMSPACDVSPYDHLEAFQDLFIHGLVSESTYDQTDIKQVFFSGRRPDAGAVQQVFAILQEQLMNKAKAPTSAFSNSTSLERSDGNGKSLSPRTAPTQLDRPRAPDQIAAFSSQREAMPANKQPVALNAFGAPATPALAATTHVDAHTYRGELELNCQLICCGHPVHLVDEGGDIVPAENVPNDEFSLIEYMFHGECELCGTLYHTSAGKPIPRDSY